jgi:hypothetical protein
VREYVEADLVRNLDLPETRESKLMTESIIGTCHCGAVRVTVPVSAHETLPRRVVKNVLPESKPAWYDVATDGGA